MKQAGAMRVVMANNKSEERTTETAAGNLPPAERQAPAVPQPADPRDQEMEALRELTRSLLVTAQAMAAQQTRSAAIQETLADVKAASRVILTSGATAAAPVPAPRPCSDCGKSTDECSESPCDCVSKNCCCFDIVMSTVRVLAMQPLELADSGANPWGELEIQMFAYLDGGIGTVIPSMFSTLSLRKLLQFPGIKVRVDRTIGTVCLAKGKTKTITIGVDAIESDAGLLERITGGRDEEGSNSATMILDCCCSVPPSVSFDVSFTSGGQGGGAIGVEFTAIRKC
jgi:hypothetical protein